MFQNDRGARSLVILGAALAVPSGLGCKPGAAAKAVAPQMEFSPSDQAVCKVASSTDRPLIVEWPSADRASLETQKRKGLVVVDYRGCEMKVLRQCRVPGSYEFFGVEAKSETVSIDNADELYAAMPVHAVKFESKLERAGSLNVQMTIVGNYDARRVVTDRVALEGACDGATHIVSSLAAGAFEFYAGSSAEVSADVGVHNVGAGGASRASQEMLTRDGSVEACAGATRESVDPPPGCGALLRIEVVPLDTPATTRMLTTTGRSEPAPPIGRQSDSKDHFTSTSARGARVGGYIGTSIGVATVLLGITGDVLIPSAGGSIAMGLGLGLTALGTPASWLITRSARNRNRDIGSRPLRIVGWASYFTGLSVGTFLLGINAGSQRESPAGVVSGFSVISGLAGGLIGADGFVTSKQLKGQDLSRRSLSPIVVVTPRGGLVSIGGRF